MTGAGARLSPQARRLRSSGGPELQAVLPSGRAGRLVLERPLRAAFRAACRWALPRAALRLGLVLTAAEAFALGLGGLADFIGAGFALAAGLPLRGRLAFAWQRLLARVAFTGAFAA